MIAAHEELAVIPNLPGKHSGTPIYDRLHDEVWPRDPAEYVSEAEAEALAARATSRWSTLLDRLAASDTSAKRTEL